MTAGARPQGEAGDHGAAPQPPERGPVGYLCQVDGTPHTAETFDWREYLAGALGTDDPEAQRALLAVTKVRRAITRTDPLLFAVLYLSHHLRGEETDGEITFSDAHLGWARQAASWHRAVTEPREYRRAEFAPRATGKTTWWFLIVPMWAAAHKIVRFAVAFADTSDQSEGHLRTFRHELANNALIRNDFRGLVHQTRNSELRGMVLDNATLLITAHGFVFAARGADTSSLGLKVGERRPDLIILDDIEPKEEGYSLASVVKRQRTLTDAILPLNEFARVIWVGTTTRHGGLAHQLVEHADGVQLGPESAWIAEERITALRWPPIVTRDDGTERSLWPAKWSLDYLNSIRHTRAYAKNMENRPVNEHGDYWSTEDFTYQTPGVTRRNVLVLDPNVNDRNEASDWTGVSVAGLDAQNHVVVHDIHQIRLTGRALKDHALSIVERFPFIGRVVIECNQGYVMWLDIFSEFPVPVDLVVADHPKHIRAAMALNHYQARPTRVIHARKFVKAESQMCAFPNVTNDDMVDTVSWAVRYLLDHETLVRPKGFALRKRPKETVTSYV
jgi:phage terminase large subunit-like protein